MVCPKCGKPSPAENSFCESCGTELQVNTENLQTDWTMPANPAPSASKELPPVRFIGFGEAVRNLFKNYANFKGRATRAEYWFGLLFFYIVTYAFSFALVGLTYVIPLTEQGFDTFCNIGQLVIAAIFLVPTQSLIWRRLHDAGKSGGWYFLYFVPIGNIFAVIWTCFFPSVGDNKYGPRKVKKPKFE